MKKSLVILVAIFLIIVFLIFCFYNYYSKAQMQANKVNEEYEKYTNESIVGSSLMTIINKATNHNEKYKVKKGYEDLYSENDLNSIKIEVRFLESDKTYPMESISKLGSEEFVKNYNSRLFKCTKKEYHKENGQIKYLLFEEIVEDENI